MSALETALADIQKVAAYIGPLVSMALVAEQATGIGGPTAEVAVQVVAAAVKALADMASGAVTHDQALASMAALRAALAGSDAAADAALAARFPAP